MTQLDLNQPLLLLMHGWPGAGKSAFARQFCERHSMAHVSSDRVRYELYDDPVYSPSENNTVLRLCEYACELVLKTGGSVVFDMCLPTQALRHKVSYLARSYQANFMIVWAQIDLDTARYRAVNRDRRRLDDRYSPGLSPTSFERLANSVGPLNLDRESCQVISGKHAFAQQARIVELRLNKLGLIDANPIAKGRVDFSRRLSGQRNETVR
ncbi:MAG TPA: AAA family ATPase [Candidatus Saccharimonadales bacterium]